MASMSGSPVPDWEPVRVSDVAQVCGPRYGTVVRRWDSGTSRSEIVTALGESGEQSVGVMAYGPLRLKLAGGILAGVEIGRIP